MYGWWMGEGDLLDAIRRGRLSPVGKKGPESHASTKRHATAAVLLLLLGKGEADYTASGRPEPI